MAEERGTLTLHTVLNLVVAVVAIALPDCINPSLIGGELFVATGPHPRRRTAAFALAAWAVTFIFGVAIALGLGDLLLSLVPKPSATVKYGLIAGAGLVLLIGGVGIWIRRDALAHSETTQTLQRSHGSAALIGAGLAGLELLTAFPYFAAIAMIVGSRVSNVAKLSLITLYCLVYALPLIVIAAIVALMGNRAAHILQPVGDWLFAHWPAIVGPLTAVVGIGILLLGILNLAS